MVLIIPFYLSNLDISDKFDARVILLELIFALSKTNFFPIYRSNCPQSILRHVP